jgi:hypothetical protein
MNGAEGCKPTFRSETPRQKVTRVLSGANRWGGAYPLRPLHAPIKVVMDTIQIHWLISGAGGPPDSLAERVWDSDRRSGRMSTRRTHRFPAGPTNACSLGPDRWRLTSGAVDIADKVTFRKPWQLCPDPGGRAAAAHYCTARSTVQSRHQQPQGRGAPVQAFPRLAVQTRMWYAMAALRRNWLQGVAVAELLGRPAGCSGQWTVFPNSRSGQSNGRGAR